MSFKMAEFGDDIKCELTLHVRNQSRYSEYFVPYSDRGDDYQE